MTEALQPTSLGAALRALADHAGAVPVAGCTDLLVVDHAERRTHPAVLDLTRIPELSTITREADALAIGAATTFTALRAAADVRRDFPMLAAAAATIGGWQIQNRATIGGNIANASPAGDSLPVLLALDAELELASAAGTRRLPYAEMHVGYRRTALRPGELIVRVRLPLAAARHHQRFVKVGTRNAQAISKLVVAMRADVTAGTIRSAHIAAGSVAATPVRLTAASLAASGRPLDAATADAVAHAGMAGVQPIDDVRSTAAYRSFALGRVLRRMVLSLAHQTP